MMVDIFNGLRNDAGCRSAKAGAKNRIDDYIRGGNLRPRGSPGRFIENRDRVIASFTPALQVGRGVATQLFGFREKIDFDNGVGHLQVTRDHQTVPAIVSLPAEHGDFSGAVLGAVGTSAVSLGNVAARGLHQLQSGKAMALGGQAVDFTHLDGGKNFHGRFAAGYSIQPPLTLTIWPVTYSASSEAKNETVAATSSTVGGLPMGKRASRMRRASLRVSSFSSMLEGFTTFTVMPFLASSSASERDSATTAALAAAYAEIFA